MNLTVYLVLKNIHKQFVEYEVPPCCSTTIESVIMAKKHLQEGCHCELKMYRRSFKYGTIFPGLQSAPDH